MAKPARARVPGVASTVVPSPSLVAGRVDRPRGRPASECGPIRAGARVDESTDDPWTTPASGFAFAWPPCSRHTYCTVGDLPPKAGREQRRRPPTSEAPEQIRQPL